MRKRTRIIITIVTICLWIILLSNLYSIFGIGRYKIGALRVKIPENFVVTETEGVDIAVSEDYPSVRDNITFVKDKVSRRHLYNESDLAKLYRYNIPGFSRFSTYEEIKVDGANAIKLTYSISRGPQDIDQTQILIFHITGTYSVTFTFTENSEYHDVFEEVMNSLKIGIF